MITGNTELTERARIIMFAQALAAEARERGFILTIEQHSTVRPAMGAHEDVATVTRARRPDGTYGE